jgi:O-antigen/teichoic acid export membrane protein
MRWRSLLHHRDLIAGATAQILQYGAALILLPLIATRLSPAEIGVWYLFVTIQAFSLLVDFGFQPNIARAFAAAFAGAPELLHEGISRSTASQPNLMLARQILSSVRRLYVIMAIVVLMALLTVGLYYVTTLGARDAPGTVGVKAAWIVFSFGIATNLCLQWASPLLMGSNRIYHNYLFTIITRGGFALLGAAALLMGGGLVSLALANFLSIILGAGFLMVVLRPVLAQLHAPEIPAGKSVLRALWYNSSRTGLVMVGGFLIHRANVFIFSVWLGLAVSAQYAFTLQVLSAAMSLAQLPTMIAVPRMTALRVQERNAELARLFLRRHALLIVTFVGMVSMIGIVGPTALSLIRSNITLLPGPIYALFALVLLLEVNSINCAYLLSTGNRVPFVTSALVSGVMVVVFTLAAIWLGWGVAGAIAAQGLVQLAYNNWKWPLEAWREIGRWT